MNKLLNYLVFYYLSFSYYTLLLPKKPYIKKSKIDGNGLLNKMITKR